MSNTEGRINRIEDKIARTMEECGMLPEHGKFIVGLSGGADSMCLAHYLSRRFSVLAAHVNHGLRGEEADTDERSAECWCRQNNVPFCAERADIAALSRETGKGEEECGRDARYRFFQELAEPGDKIATAHTLSDQAETVLYRLAKGAGLRGLCGIPPVRGNIVRPLLCITRGEVEEYCSHYQLPYRTDSTNLSRDYARNRIRLDVVPVLKELNPSFETAILRAAQSFREDEEYLENCALNALRAAEKGGAYSAGALKPLPPALRNRAAAGAVFQKTGIRLFSGHIREISALLGQGENGRLTLPGRVDVRVENGLFFVLPPKGQKEAYKMPVKMPQTELWDEKTAEIEILSKKEFENRAKFNNLLFNNAFDYDTITCNMFWRNRKEGDKFRPAGRGVTKTLKNLFQEKKVPAVLRSKIVLLESGGELVWAEGFGASERSAVKESTGRVALITIKENGHG